MNQGPPMLHAQDDTRILNTRPLLPPAILIEEIPLSAKAHKNRPKRTQ